MRVRNLLRLKAFADDALAHRDDSMGMVSHDLRSLLNGIVLNAELLADQAQESEEGRRMVEGVQRIQRYAARMGRLIEDLVDVVSIEAGKLALEAEPSDAAALLGEAVEAHGQAAAARGVALTVVGVERPLVASFDRGRMLQVLANLISNALRFTPSGGAVAVGGQCIGEDLHLHVSDTGSGIPDGMLKAIFERYLQLSGGDQGGRGLGLGLYISKIIVESHGGAIWAESEVGEGSVFHVRIPVAVPAAKARGPREPARDGPGRAADRSEGPLGP